jgi:hypothetical protein
MKQIVKALCLGALLLAIGSAAQAQESGLRHSIFLNVNIPTGDFGSSVSSSHTVVPLTYEEIGKDASLGFGIGYRASYSFPIGMGSVAPFVGIDILWNTIDGEWSDKYSDAYFDVPTYFNVPLMAGINYTYEEVWDNITPFGEFGVGTDFLWITHEGTGSTTNYFAYKPTFAFSWMIGAGVYFGKYVSAGLYYYGMGKHTIDYTSGTMEDNSVAATQVMTNDALGMGRQQRTVGSLMFRVGFHF